jgi:hypothetical protein
LTDFPIQLGSIQEPYGFDRIIGIDFMMRAKSKVNFETLNIEFANWTMRCHPSLDTNAWFSFAYWVIAIL